MSGGALNLSLLSRGVGEIHINGHEKVDVYLEPEDYLNFSASSNKLCLPSIQPRNPLTHADNSQAFQTSNEAKEFRVPKTYSTRKGALLLFSEDLAQKYTSTTIGPPVTNTENILMNGGHSQVSLKTVEDLANSILKYGSQGHLNDKIYLKFVRAHCGTFERQFRPGFSAKRYLSTWTRTLDDSILGSIIRNGYLAEHSLYQQDSTASNLRRRLVFDDLSRMPEPYKLMKNMLMSPDSLSGYTFYSGPIHALGEKLESKEQNQNEDVIVLEHKSDKLHNIQVVQTRGRVQEQVHYSDLDHQSQKEVITDLLVKSAVHYAMKKQEEVYKDWIVRAMRSDLGESLTEENTEKEVRSAIQEFDMRQAVESLLDSHGRLPEGARTDGGAPSSDRTTGSSNMAVSSNVPRHAAQHNSIWYCNGSNEETGYEDEFSPRSDSSTPSLPSCPVLPPIRVTLSPIRDSSRETSQVISLPIIQGSRLRKHNQFNSETITSHQTSMTTTLLPQLRTNIEAETSGLTSPDIDALSLVEEDATQATEDDTFKREERITSITDQGLDTEMGSPSINVSESDIMDMLTSHARQVAESVLTHPSAGTDLGTDVKLAAELWSKMHPSRSLRSRNRFGKVGFGVIDEIAAAIRPGRSETSSADEYKSLISKSGAVTKAAGIEPDSSVEDADISPQLLEDLSPDQTEIVTDCDDHAKMQAKEQNGEKMSRQQISIPDGSVVPQENAVHGQSQDWSQEGRAKVFVNQKVTPPFVKKTTKDPSNSSKISSKLKAAAQSMVMPPENTSKDSKKTGKSSDKGTGKGTGKGTEKGKHLKDKEDPFVAGMPKEKKQTPAQLPAQREDKKVTNKEVKGKKKVENKSLQQKVVPAKQVEKPEISKVERKLSPQSVSPDIDQSKMSSPGMKSEGSELEFSFVRELSALDNEDMEAEEIVMAMVQMASPALDDDDEDKLDSESGDDQEASKLKSISNREARAAKRAAAAVKRREEVERRRKLKEEQMKKEKIEIERQIELQKEMEEQRKRVEEERRLHKQQKMEEDEREKMESQEIERRQKLETEKERRAKEEFQRKLDEMRRKQQEEEMKKRDLMLLKQREEEERRASEEFMLSKMEKHERLEYERRKKQEEEERIQRELENKLRRDAQAQAAMEEARRLTEEMSRKQAELEARLQFNRSLQDEASKLSQSHTINRAFVFSYFELLQWLGLDIPEFELAKLAE